MRTYNLGDPADAQAYAEHIAHVDTHNRGKVGTHDGAKYTKLAEHRRLRDQRRARINPPPAAT